MYKDKKFSNNYALAGVTALMYNVHMDMFFNTNDSIKEEFNNVIKDIGFQWKEASSSNWIVFSLKTATLTYIKNLNNLILNDEERNDGYMFGHYSDNAIAGVYPIRVLIKNLMSGGVYNLRSYYTTDEGTNYYNDQTITLLTNGSTMHFSEPNISSSATENVSEQELQDFTNRCAESCNLVQEIYSMFFCDYTTEIKLAIDYDSGGNWAAKAGGNNVTFNSAYRSESVYGVRSVLVHEMAHNTMFKDFNNPNPTYKDKIIKFMEFATNAPYAMWKWQSAHNYPVISSARYGFMDDCLVVAACQLSKQRDNT